MLRATVMGLVTVLSCSLSDEIMQLGLLQGRFCCCCCCEAKKAAAPTPAPMPTHISTATAAAHTGCPQSLLGAGGLGAWGGTRASRLDSSDSLSEPVILTTSIVLRFSCCCRLLQSGRCSAHTQKSDVREGESECRSLKGTEGRTEVLRLSEAVDVCVTSMLDRKMIQMDGMENEH